ncbi:unnamed protein product [Effrenium voratum]|nr:unnamed protein product [Effrenium voratum]
MDPEVLCLHGRCVLLVPEPAERLVRAEPGSFFLPEECGPAGWLPRNASTLLLGPQAAAWLYTSPAKWAVFGPTRPPLRAASRPHLPEPAPVLSAALGGLDVALGLGLRSQALVAVRSKRSRLQAEMRSGRQ